MSRPIIEVSSDLAGGIILSTKDKWLIEDVSESVARVISPKAFVDLSLALDAFDQSDNHSRNQLDLARVLVGSETAKKSIVLARMLPFEVVGLIAALTAALEKSA